LAGKKGLKKRTIPRLLGEVINNFMQLIWFFGFLRFNWMRFAFVFSMGFGIKNGKRIKKVKLTYYGLGLFDSSFD
jgi:hypothetical protein